MNACPPMPPDPLQAFRERMARLDHALRLGQRWRNLQITLLAPGVPAERRRRVHYLCNRLADRIDALKPHPEQGPMLRCPENPERSGR